MIIRTLTTAAIIAGALAVAAPAAADEGCTVGDYQGAPVEMCPVQEPDPTNCYTGDYQGAPIEICLPTGEQLPEGSTYNGEPVVYHVSKDYVAPVVDAAPIEEAAPIVDPVAPVTSKLALFAQKLPQ